MLRIEEEEMLKTLAYQAWLERGQPFGSPHIDWERAKLLLKNYHQVSFAILNSAAGITDCREAALPVSTDSKVLQLHTE